MKGKLGQLRQFVEAVDAMPEPQTPLMEAARYEIEQGSFSRLLMEAATTTDFPKLLRNTMYKGMMKEWQEYPSTYETIVSEFGNARDFREITRQRVSTADELLAVAEHGEYKDQDLLEEDLKYSVAKYGRLFGVSWELLINDDMGQIKRQPERMGKAAAKGLDKDIWKYVFGNPTLSLDKKQLFSIDHLNKNTSNNGTNAIGEASLTKAFKAMRTQRDLRGDLINIQPRFLVIGPALEIHAWKVLQGSMTMPLMQTPNAALQIGQGGNSTFNAGFPNTQNYFRGKLEIIVCRWIESDTAWYLVADPRQHDTIEVSFLRGQREPEMFVQDGSQGRSFDRDEIRYKMRHVWGKHVLDYRSWYQGSE